MIYYIGFSSKNKFAGSSLAGIALSEYTFGLLSAVTQAKLITISQNGNLDDDTIRASKIHFLTMIKLTLHILLKISRLNDKIIFYHSPIYFIPCMVFIALGYRVILQVNEVFYRTENYSRRKVHVYLETLLLRKIKEVIVSTEKLKNFLPSNVNIITEISGPLLKLEETRQGKKQRDCAKSLVYAGIIDTAKNRGAFMSAEVMTFLPKNYCLDIYGFGNSHDIIELKSFIANHGLQNVSICEQLNPKELNCILRKYDFGLAIQNIDNQFSFSSFPSKIITYLGAGLEVICMNVDIINEWRFVKYVRYEHDNTAESIAKYIERLSFNAYIDTSSFASDYETSILNELREKL